MKKLYLRSTNIINLNYLPLSVKVLDLSHTKIIDFTILQTLIELEELNLSDTEFYDLSCLPKTVRKLNLSYTNIIDFTLLKYFTELEELDLTDTLFNDFYLLSNLQYLRYINNEKYYHSIYI